MSNIAPAYPITWPATFPRSVKRESGRFKTTLAGSIKNTQDSLQIAHWLCTKRVETCEHTRASIPCPLRISLDR